MNDKLQKALGLLTDFEQEALAEELIERFAKNDAIAWGAAHAAAPEKLLRMRDEAQQAYLNGETEPLDPEKL